MGRDLTEGSVLKLIVATSWPMVVAFLLHSAFNLVDAYFVGKISADALAAVSVSFPVVFLIISLSSGIGAGTTSLVSRYIGARDFKRAGEVAEHAIFLGVLVSVLFAVAGIMSVDLLFDLIGVTSGVKTISLDYINIILAGSPFMFLGMVGNSIIRGEGEMKFPMYVMAVGAILNTILDPILIFNLDLGVRGAAYATVISRSMALLVIVAYLASERTWIKLRLKKFSLDMRHIRGIFHVGVPSSLSNLSMSVGLFFLTAIVTSFGTEALAAYGIGFRLDMIAYLPAIGVSVAVMSLVGQNVGARKYDRAEEITFKAGFLATAFMLPFGVFFFAFAPQIIAGFNNTPLVVEYGTTLLRIYAASYLVAGLVNAISGAFLGAGHPIPSFILNLRLLVLGVPIAFTLSKPLGLSGVWWGNVIGIYIAAVMGVIWFKKGGWKKPGKINASPVVSP